MCDTIIAMIEQMQKKIDSGLAQFLKRAEKDYRFHLVDDILWASIKEFCLRPGKRIRPLLLVLSYKGYCRKNIRMTPSIYYVSTCIELLHNFMLIHDDIIDRSDLRRGRPTMHKLLEHAVKTPRQEQLGKDLAIVAGDIVYALAIDAFLSINEDKTRKEQALKYFIQTAVFTAMGEFIDTLHGVKSLNQITEKDVFLNYSLKTARYTFDCPLVVGAVLAGAPQRQVNLLSELGLLIGQAFQIQDDIIGVFDTQKNIGKSVLSDIAESKKTILVCHSYRHLRGKRRKQFLHYFQKPRFNYSDLKMIRDIFIQAGSLAYALEEIQRRLRRADQIRKKLTIKPPHLRGIEACLLKLFRHSELIQEQFLSR